MGRRCGFVSFKNKYGKTEMLSASKISMIYFDDDEGGYIVLFDDGCEIMLDLFQVDVNSLINDLIIVDSL